MRRAALACGVALLLAAGCGGGSSPSPPSPSPPGSTSFTVGRGAQGATVLVPAGGARGRPVVLFLHGWGAVAPHFYGPWIRHLVARGDVVVFPRYQENVLTPPPQALPNAVIGIRLALARLPRPRQVVVVGHSAGGALGPDLTAIAPQVGIPRPRAVLSIYPGRALPRIPARVPSEDLRRIPASTRVVVYAGADDQVVGTATAHTIARQAHGRFILVRDPSIDDHVGPQRDEPASRRTFWAALDRLVTATR